MSIGEVFALVKSIIAGVVVFLMFWLVALLVQKLIVRVARLRGPEQQHVYELLGKLAKFGVAIMGLISALGTAGVNVNALVASLGLTGFAMGFALKDFLSNMLAGILLLIYQPFRRGDYIKLTDYEGRIEKIDLRYAVLSHEDKKIFIPNSTLMSSAVVVNAKTSKQGELL